MLNINLIAETICAGNPKLVEWINSNEENYKPVRAQVNSIARGLADKYNDGAFINNNELHKLTWAIIDVAKGNISPIAIGEF